MSAPIGYVLDATEGEPQWFLGARVTYKTTSTQNGGGLFLAEFHAPRGHATPLHVHTDADEMFYVLSGHLTVEFAGEQRTVTDGGFVFGPRNVEHRFRVDSEEAHFLVLTTPAGFEDFVRVARIAPEHGIQIIGPPLEDLRL